MGTSSPAKLLFVHGIYVNVEGTQQSNVVEDVLESFELPRSFLCYLRGLKCIG